MQHQYIHPDNHKSIIETQCVTSNDSMHSDDMDNIIEKYLAFGEMTSIMNEKYQHNSSEYKKAIVSSANELQLNMNLFNKYCVAPTISHDKYGKATKSQLQFEEYNASLAETLKFAEVDASNNFLGNLTAGTLNMFIQEVGSNIEKDFIFSLAFPDISVPMYKVVLDRIKGNSGIASEFGGDSSVLPVTKQLDKYILEYQSGLWGNKVMITAQDIFFARERGNITLNERGIQQIIAYNTVNLVTQCMTRKKKLIIDALFFNGFSYGGRTINSNIPSANYINFGASKLGILNPDGSVTPNADPAFNPLVSLTNIVSNPKLLKYRNYIKGFIMNDADLRVLLNAPQVKAVTNALMMGGISLTEKTIKLQMGKVEREVTGYYASGFNIPLMSDGQVWVEQDAYGNMNNDAQNFFVPRGKVYLLIDTTKIGGRAGAFHLTYNQIDPNITSPAMGLFTGVFNRNLQNADTVNRIDLVAGIAGAPAVYMPEAQFIIDGLYE